MNQKHTNGLFVWSGLDKLCWYKGTIPLVDNGTIPAYKNKRTILFSDTLNHCFLYQYKFPTDYKIILCSIVFKKFTH